MVTREEKNKKIQNEIEEEKLREKRKKFIKLFLKVTIIIIIVFFVIFFYTKYSATNGLIVKEERIIDEKIPQSFDGLKIVQFTDLNYGSTVFSDEINNLVKAINIRKPDIIVFTGNIIDNNYEVSIKEKEKIINSLKKLDASIGKYAINGQKDEDDTFTTIMNQSEFTILDNNYDLVYNDDNNPILLVGLSSLVNNKRNIEEGFKYFNEESHNSNIYTIVLESETDDLDDIIQKYNPNLVLAGNSLNGQIRIPFIGGIIKSEGSDKYIDPFYSINNTKVYISSGIGSPGVGFRLFAHPSINFFRLSNKE